MGVIKFGDMETFRSRIQVKAQMLSRGLHKYFPVLKE
jgi:hypothetical protein